MQLQVTRGHVHACQKVIIIEMSSQSGQHAQLVSIMSTNFAEQAKKKEGVMLKRTGRKSNQQRPVRLTEWSWENDPLVQEENLYHHGPILLVCVCVYGKMWYSPLLWIHRVYTYRSTKLLVIDCQKYNSLLYQICSHQSTQWMAVDYAGRSNISGFRGERFRIWLCIDSADRRTNEIEIIDLLGNCLAVFLCNLLSICRQSTNL